MNATPQEVGASAAALAEAGQEAERLGDHDQARRHYAGALASLGGSDPSLAGSLLRWVARTYLEDGELEHAVAYADRALALSTGAGDRSGVAQAHNLRGNIERERGELDAAEALYHLARSDAEETGELRLLAMVEQNLGVLANIRGDFRRAFKQYRASLERHRALGSSPYVAHALNNLGMLLTDLGRLRAAHRAFSEAFDLCAELGDTATQARIASNRIEVLIAQRRWSEARGACVEAQRLAQQAGVGAALGEIFRHRGVIARETGDWAGAAEQLGRAAELAEERRDLLLGAETAREQARLAWKRSAHRETLLALNRAHGLFVRLQARRDVAEISARIKDLEESFLGIVAHWGQSIESADRYTHGHCERVARYACALARAVGLPGEVLLWFRMGALLHDVGKIGVPAEILNKPGALSAEERAVMEGHPEAGVRLLSGIDFPWDIRPMVRHHHEAWDGSGYPARLAGEAIPLSARILTVADVYDALSTDRPYRPAYSREHCLRIMEDSAGRVLDPALFAVFRELDLEGGSG